MKSYAIRNSYTLFLNSTDKVSGTNNNANYDVNWDDFLPRDIDYYKVVFLFKQPEDTIEIIFHSLKIQQQLLHQFNARIK
jgi:hypothetical protein